MPILRVAIFILITVGLSSADTITLKDGTKFSGVEARQENGQVIFEQYGAEFKYPIDQVSKWDKQDQLPKKQLVIRNSTNINIETAAGDMNGGVYNLTTNRIGNINQIEGNATTKLDENRFLSKLATSNPLYGFEITKDEYIGPGQRSFSISAKARSSGQNDQKKKIDRVPQKKTVDEKPTSTTDKIISDIKASLAAKYPGKYSTQKMLLDANIGAYNYIVTRPKTKVSLDVIRRLTERYYPSFTTIKLLYENEMKAYAELNQ